MMEQQPPGEVVQHRASCATMGRGPTMGIERFDAVVKALASSGSRRRLLGGLLAAVAAGWRPSWTSAQEEIAAAGNGGTADASANGGAVATGNLNSGENAGHAIGVGDTVGGVEV